MAGLGLDGALKSSVVLILEYQGSSMAEMVGS